MAPEWGGQRPRSIRIHNDALNINNGFLQKSIFHIDSLDVILQVSLTKVNRGIITLGDWVSR